MDYNNSALCVFRGMHKPIEVGNQSTSPIYVATAQMDDLNVDDGKIHGDWEERIKIVPRALQPISIMPVPRAHIEVWVNKNGRWRRCHGGAIEGGETLHVTQKLVDDAIEAKVPWH